jgi:hypothetical protein
LKVRESNLVEENWFLKTIVLLRCESIVATPDPAKAYLCYGLAKGKLGGRLLTHLILYIYKSTKHEKRA